MSVNVHLRALRYFLVLAEELHFSRAAAALYVSQPALSKQIGQLERALNTTLFTRTSRSVKLTSSGAILYRHARSIVAMWDTALQAVAEGDENVLTVGFRPGRRLLTEAIRAFSASNWPSRVTIREVGGQGLLNGLSDGRIDIGIAVLSDPGSPGFSQLPLFADRLLVCLPPNHPLADRSEVPFGAVVQQTPLLLNEASDGLRSIWVHAATRFGFDISRGVTVTNLTELEESVALGLGAGLVAESSIDVAPVSPRWVLKPVTGLEPNPVQIGVVWRTHDSRRTVHDFAATCREIAVAQIGAAPSSGSTSPDG